MLKYLEQQHYIDIIHHQLLIIFIPQVLMKLVQQLLVKQEIMDIHMRVFLVIALQFNVFYINFIAYFYLYTSVKYIFRFILYRHRKKGQFRYIDIINHLLLIIFIQLMVMKLVQQQVE